MTVSRHRSAHWQPGCPGGNDIAPMRFVQGKQPGRGLHRDASSSNSATRRRSSLPIALRGSDATRMIRRGRSDDGSDVRHQSATLSTAALPTTTGRQDVAPDRVAPAGHCCIVDAGAMGELRLDIGRVHVLAPLTRMSSARPMTVNRPARIDTAEVAGRQPLSGVLRRFTG